MNLLPDADWRHKPGMDRLLDSLDAGKGQARFVGGAVRDTLVGVPVKDVDIATRLLPTDVLARLKAAGIKAVPTGMAHGTITAVLDGWPVEVTTLRRDVATDGRRATVAFADDWRDDAARRDFTINALYAEPDSGVIHDYFGGLDDLEARRVRFIGDARARIAEDHLRILRHYRFYARFGADAPDAEAHAACVAMAQSQMALSRERIADELIKLLAVADPTHAIALMVDGGIFAPIVPEITQAGAERLKQLVARETDAGIPGAALRRLAALLPHDAAIGEGVAARLKLSIRARKRISVALGPVPAPTDRPEELAYRIGNDSAVDMILLDPECEPAGARVAQAWTRRKLPISGGALIAMGLPQGPTVSAALKAVEDRWIAEGFPDAARTRAIADQIVSNFQRADQ